MHVVTVMQKTTTSDQTVELYEEQAFVERREIETGRVVVETKVETKQHVVEAILRQENVDVERVPINQIVDQVPSIREVDGVLIIPVIEEKLVVQTHLLLKEELRVTRTSSEHLARTTVPLRSETATVTRLPEASKSSPHPGDKT